MIQLITLSILVFLVVARCYFILPGKKASYQRRTRTCSLAVFLGSGGHTSEAINLVSSLDFLRYTPRTYIISEGDTLSAQKVIDLERIKTKSQDRVTYRILTLARARHVHQSFLSTPPTFIRSLLHALYHVFLFPALRYRSFADLVIFNGPGTCVPVCAAAYLSRFIGLPSPRLIYVESFARVKTLSLSGKILRPFVDRFIVQWPDILVDGKRGECKGWLV